MIKIVGKRLAPFGRTIDELRVLIERLIDAQDRPLLCLGKPENTAAFIC